jgi:hypothetical protein
MWPTRYCDSELFHGRNCLSVFHVKFRNPRRAVRAHSDSDELCCMSPVSYCRSTSALMMIISRFQHQSPALLLARSSGHHSRGNSAGPRSSSGPWCLPWSLAFGVQSAHILATTSHSSCRDYLEASSDRARQHVCCTPKRYSMMTLANAMLLSGRWIHLRHLLPASTRQSLHSLQCDYLGRVRGLA